MKIKIIDLLNKIANEEKVPKKIKYNNKIYERYQNISTNNLYYYQVPNKCEFLIDQLSSAIDLLDEVEIIEEPKKIEKLEPVRDSDLSDLTDKDMVLKNNALIELCKTLNNMNNKINELIDKINNLKDK